MSNKVTFASSNGLTFTALLGATTPKITGGYGGWQEYARPKKIAAVIWSGRSPYRLSVPIVFDGYLDGVGQDTNISKLERISGQGGVEPPSVKIKGKVPHADLTWYVDNLDWGEDVIITDKGVTMRRDVVVNLVQKVEDQRITETKVRTGVPSSYTVQPGDTLQSIAIKWYGDVQMWRKIADANNIRDPKHPPVHKSIRLP